MSTFVVLLNFMSTGKSVSTWFVFSESTSIRIYIGVVITVYRPLGTAKLSKT